MPSRPTLNGILLEEFVDVSGTCGVAYYKGVACCREMMEFSRAVMVFPRGASVIDIESADDDARPAQESRRSVLHKERVTAAQMVLLPAHRAHAIVGESSIMDVFVVVPSEAVFTSAANAYGIAPEKIDKMLTTTHVLPRTVWVNELQHRYFYERFVCRKRDNVATTFLEMELVKEIYFLSADAARAPTCAPALLQTNTLGRRAVAYVETHLFEPTLNVATIAEHTRASRSSIERAFKSEVGRSPNEYIRDRRLDEANALIVTGRLPVGQVATIVGYQNFSAFSHAFRRRFEISPSQVVTRNVGGG